MNDLQLSESLTTVSLLDLKWAIYKRYVESDPVWVGLNSISILSSYGKQSNKLGYKKLTGKSYPNSVKFDWVIDWKNFINLVSKIVEMPSSQIEYHLKPFTCLNDENNLAIRSRNFSGHKVVAQNLSLLRSDGIYWMYDYQPITNQLRMIPAQLLKEQMLEYDYRVVI